MRVDAPLVYVAGPLTRGDLINNVREAVLAGERLRSGGIAPVIPHLTAFWHFLTPNNYEAWMDYDFAVLSRCDGLLRVPGDSPGADREVAFARERGIPVFAYVGSAFEHFRGLGEC